MATDTLLQPGRYRESIQIQQPNGTPGTLGQASWTVVATVRGWLESLTGKELDSAQMGGAQVDHVFHVRYRTGITAKMRCYIGRDNSRRFDVQYVRTLTEGNARELLIYCKEVMPL